MYGYSSKWIGPYGGTFVSIAIDPADPQVVYAGSYGSGVYKSLDGGNTWSLASQGLTNLFVYSLAIDPSHPSNIYAGTYRNQIFKSTNGGNSWRWSGSGMQAKAIVYNIAIDPVSPNIIYAATRGISNNGSPPWKGVVYKSTNAGVSWAPCLTNLGGSDVQDWVYSVIVNPHSHDEVLVAAHEYGPIRSDNYGSTWYSIDNGVSDYSGRSIAISQIPDYARTYYYGVWHLDTIYKSTDGAASWRPVNQGHTYQHVYSIALDPQNVRNVFLATFVNGILKTTDGGTSWQSSGLSIDHIYSVTMNPQTTSQLLAGTAGDGISRSEDAGQSWYHSNTGIDNAMVTSVVVSPSNSERLYASLYGGGIYQTDYQGDIWNEINIGLTDLFVHDLVMDPAHPEVLYALTDQGGLFTNDLNTGNGWIYAGAGLPLTSSIQPAYPPDHPFATLDMQEAFAEQSTTNFNPSSVHVALFKMTYAPSSSQIAYLATGGTGVYRSSNGGQSWLPAGLTSQSITTLAVDLTNPDLVYAATGTSSSLLVSTNGGKNWTSVSSPAIIYSLSASPLATGILYAGTGNGIYRYQAGAWTSLGLSGRIVTAVKLDPAHPGLLYAGTDKAGYYSKNNGQNWSVADENLIGQTIEAITVNPNNPSLVYFSTMTHGIFLFAFQS